jgi:hypothetical protein
VGGMEIVREIGKIPTDINERPKIKVVIFTCGDYDTRRIHLIEDPFKKVMENLHKERLEKEKIKIMGPEEADEYRRSLKVNAFDIIQHYSDDEGKKKGKVYLTIR